MSFITIEYSRDLLTKVFSFSFIVLICTVKYNMLYFKSEQVSLIKKIITQRKHITQ